jgi:hypothetical protein
MASLRRFNDSRYWFARFIGPEGKQQTCSTKEVDKRRAQKIADRFELAARMARIGGLAARQARKVIGEIYEISNREPLPHCRLLPALGRSAPDHARPQDRCPVWRHHQNLSGVAGR